MWRRLFVFVCVVLNAGAAEKWADRAMPISEGVVWWLDASRQQAAWQANGKRALTSDGVLDVVFDGSDHAHHAVQAVAGAQPTWRGSVNGAVIAFDGIDDFLGAQIGSAQSWESFSVFVVAAPASNSGAFRALLCGHKTGRNDFQTGFNIDLGPEPTRAWTVLNAEGAGFGGARDLLDAEFEWKKPRVVDAHAHREARQVRVFVDGRPSGQRSWKPEPLRIAELKIGARLASNTPAPPFVNGFFHGEIAEVLVFNRSLPDAEAEAVRKYLQTKYAALEAALAATREGHRLRVVKDPPMVQMLVPGFTVRELPVDLTNINNLLYRPDGKLVAVAYNGDILLLSDTNGDGLEDKADIFYPGKGKLVGPVGIDLTADGHGVFTPSKGKVSLILDHDHDGKADEEKIIAEGFPPARGGVDITAVARDPRDGAIYHGLGVRWFDNAYEIDDQGVAHYKPTDERGGIQRISPDFRKREALCTGIRFPIALRFNAEGDLFATEQEGATWLPNGNPFDELLHIQRGRHYGFPPRHPKHLPNVIDEPSVFDFGPQHQSTCGMNFNLPVNGGPIFGPDTWRGDALIVGESRGKLWRTRLAKTEHGYVADTQLLACLNMLVTDVCVSPRGEAVLCCHTGPPDWGTGPEGKGKLFKISRTDGAAPQPVAAWAEAPGILVVEFDQSLSPELTKNWAGAAKIERGRWVRAGDRFEGVRPPYDVVALMMAEPRFDVAVQSVQLSPDFRRVMLGTEPQRRASDHFAVTLPNYDLHYDLTGVEVEWRSADGSEREVGWAPVLDLEAAADLRQAGGDTLFSQQRPKEGILTLRTQLDLTHMLQPAVQPGATLDFDYPAEKVTVYFASKSQEFSMQRKGVAGVPSKKGHVSNDAMFTVTTRGVGDGRSAKGSGGTDKEKSVPEASSSDRSVAATTFGLEAVEIQLRVKAGEKPHLTAAWHTDEDQRLRAFPRRRYFMPFVLGQEPPGRSQLASALVPKKIEGGNWARGREIFFGEDTQCAKCHTVRGHGTMLGPDLSNLVHRDAAAVRRDLLEPSATLNPDFLAYEVEKTDGTKIAGVPKLQADGSWQLGIGAGAFLPIAKADVKSMKPLSISLMPASLNLILGEDGLRDLLTFLLIEPPLMGEYASVPRDGVEHPPPPRAAEDVDRVLAGAPNPLPATRPIRVILVAGEKDHGKGEHDYPRWQRAWGRLLAMAEKAEIETAWEWPSAEQWKTADSVVFFCKGDWSLGRARDIDAFLNRGGGLVYIHWAVEAGEEAPELARRIGLASNGPKTSWRHGPFDLVFADDSRHPIARNFTRVHFHDESYWKLIGDPSTITPLATAIEDGAPQPLFWTAERGGNERKGRVFVSIPGHYSWTFDDPLFRVLLLRGLAWSAKEPVDRFNDLVEAGIEP
ncbi:MAG: ThuA domain-containing protein [Verrucomicrobiales bacterium]